MPSRGEFESLTGMEHLHFLNQLMANKLALNPARVLLYIEANPHCQQKDMLKPLSISRGVLSQCCQLLLNKRLIVQHGSYVSKKHYLAPMGLELITSIKNGNS